MTTPHKWKQGDRFKVNPDFSMAYDDDDNVTGVVDGMMQVKDEEQEVDMVLPRRFLPKGIIWLLAKGNSYVWRSDWVSPMIEEVL